MSASWSTIGGATWQTLLDEITLGYSERRQSLQHTAYTATDGKDVQAASYWVAMQTWLETNCVNYIDHAQPYAPLNAGSTDFVYFTLDTWQTEAGLHNSSTAGESFRRATSWDGTTTPTWEYGFMQAGDIIGPWIFEDLQNGMGALKWVFSGGSDVGQGVNLGPEFYSVGVVDNEVNEGNGSDSVCLVARSLAVDSYNLGGGSFAGDLYGVAVNSAGGASTSISVYRNGGAAQAVGVGSFAPHAMDVYGWVWNGVDDTASFWDGDGLGLTAHKYNLLTSLAETATPNPKSALIRASANPLDLYPIACPVGSVYAGAWIAQPLALIKWNFTNA